MKYGQSQSLLACLLYQRLFFFIFQKDLFKQLQICFALLLSFLHACLLYGCHEKPKFTALEFCSITKLSENLVCTCAHTPTHPPTHPKILVDLEFSDLALGLLSNQWSLLNQCTCTRSNCHTATPYTHTTTTPTNILKQGLESWLSG